jgi:ribose 5-phosphate isomerase
MKITFSKFCDGHSFAAVLNGIKGYDVSVRTTNGKKTEGEIIFCDSETLILDTSTYEEPDVKKHEIDLETITEVMYL